MYKASFRYYRKSTDSWVTIDCITDTIYAWHEPFNGFEIVNAEYVEAKGIFDENHQ